MELERAEKKNEAGSWVRGTALVRLVGAAMLVSGIVGFVTGLMVRMPSYAGAALSVLSAVVVLGAFLLYVRHLQATWLRGFDAEKRVGDFIEHALTQSGCAVAHDVKGGLGGSGGNVDHIAMTPTGLWVIETKASWQPRNLFKSALKQTAGNVRRVRGHLGTSLPVRGALVIADPDIERYEADNDWRGEPILCLDAKSLWRLLREERRAAVAAADPAEVARVRELVWNLGSAAHASDG